MTGENSVKKQRKTINQLSASDIETLIVKQKERIKNSKMSKGNNIELILEKTKLARLERELENRDAGQIRLQC